jgi:hypothetical protein
MSCRAALADENAWARARRRKCCKLVTNPRVVPKRDYLSLERTPRPEEVQEDPPEQIENLEHPAFIARFGRSGQADGICGRDKLLAYSVVWLA